jgi:hypothetical protein
MGVDGGAAAVLKLLILPGGAGMRVSRRILELRDSFAAVTLCVLFLAAHAYAETPGSPLPSWNDGPAKQAIIAFVNETTDKSGPHYVEPENRIAAFDQDGTLWVEHPLDTEAAFALARVHDLAPRHPEWRDRQPFKAVLDNDREAIAKFSESDWKTIVVTAAAGVTHDAYRKIVQRWLGTAKDPKFNHLYTELVYQPMLEVMQLLRAHGFKTYIVTGGGQPFARVYSERVYGVPPEQVVGSSMLTTYQNLAGKPVLMIEPKVFFIDDGPEKPVAINLFIGKRPCAAFGNSDNDRQMLEWTQAGAGARLAMLVLHDDPKREYAYGPAGDLADAKAGPSSDSLVAEARQNHWVTISMKSDWKRVFAFEQQP